MGGGVPWGILACIGGIGKLGIPVGSVWGARWEPHFLHILTKSGMLRFTVLDFIALARCRPKEVSSTFTAAAYSCGHAGEMRPAQYVSQAWWPFVFLQWCYSAIDAALT